MATIIKNIDSFNKVMTARLIILIAFFTSLMVNCKSQSLATQFTESNNYSWPLDSTLISLFSTEYNHASFLIQLLINKKFNQINNIFTSIGNFWDPGDENSNLKKANKLLLKHGMPSTRNTVLSASHPIAWILADSMNTTGHIISFVYLFSGGKQYPGKYDQIEIAFQQNYDIVTMEKYSGYSLYKMSFWWANRRSAIEDMINDIKLDSKSKE